MLPTTLTDEQSKQLLQTVSQPQHKIVSGEAGRFRPQGLGFFGPDNDNERLVENTDNSTVYYNVFSFAARVKAKARGVTEGIFSANRVASQLDQCLKGKAELWYTNEISRTTRAGLKASIENWCEKLETRFQMSPEIALEKLE